MTRDGFLSVLFLIVMIIGLAVAAIKKPAHGQDCTYGAFGCGHHATIRG